MTTFRLRRPILLIPTAAMVPSTTAMAEARKASIREFQKEDMMRVLSKRLLYHFRVKPVKSARDLDSLKEKAMRTKIGA